MESSKLIVNPSDAAKFPDALVASSNITPAELSVITTAGITAAGKMAAALTDVRMAQPQGHIYAGTVDPAKVKATRAANKRARKARRASRV
jgi:hypothetical protein